MRLKRAVLQERSSEGSEIIKLLLSNGLTIEQIAVSAHVSSRTVYRWLNEGRAPHPAFLEALRRLGAEKNVRHEG